MLIVAPHTSNWDFIVGIRAMYALGIRGTYLGKDTLFRFPLGIVMRWLGGFPVDRSTKSDVVTQTVELVGRMDKVIIVLAPEGTRKRTPRWRSGFYWIAQKSGMPILPVAFDFGKKEIFVNPLFYPTGDQENDIAYSARSTGRRWRSTPRSTWSSEERRARLKSEKRGTK